MTTTIGRYQIIRPLGAGGMADVYLAQDPTLGRQVAIKVIGSGRFDANLLARFMREARTVANLEHPAIVPLYDYGEQDGRPYLVMRYMAGGSLSERIARRPLSLAEATTVVSRIAAALDFAHAQGIIHRDVKPDNILFDDAGAAYLSDFGIARYAAIGTGKSLTSTGAVIGTTAYMSPEQALGKGDLDGRSDLYSLGAVLFEALSGDVPYKADSALQQAMLHINAPIPDIRARRPDLPPVTQTIISRVLAKEPQARYQSAAALTGDLRRVTDNRRLTRGYAPPKNKSNDVPTWLWIGILAVAALILGGMAITFGGQSSTTRKSPVNKTGQPLGIMADTTDNAQLSPESETFVEVPPAISSELDNIPTSTVLPVTNSLLVTRVLNDTPNRSRWVNRGGLEIEQIFVPSGSFRMGSENGEEDERPIFDTAVTAFWIDRTEVTNKQYAGCVNAGVCAPPDKPGSQTRDNYYNESLFADYPVIWVSWLDADIFCRWAGGRLPSEAEWEYAARGPSSLEYSWGNTFEGNRLNFCDLNCPFDWADSTVNDGYLDIAPVGSFPQGASWVGALDMSGNVWEWVADWYDAAAYRSALPANGGPEKGQSKVLRGGAWYGDARVARAADRNNRAATFANTNIGFRCAANEEKDDQAASVNTIAPDTPTISTAPLTTNELPFFMNRLVTADDLAGLSQWELDVMRNEIFARYGRRFNRPDLQAYFDAQPWYTRRYNPEDFPTDQLLTEIQKQNAKFILEYQDQ